MKFSVIIPVYNAQKYLCECVESILEQSRKVHEVILVNDGSVDSSAEICDAYHTRFPNQIKVIHSSNDGALAARATGILHSTGDILIFIDADDRFRKDAIEVLDCAFTSEDCDLVIFNGSVKDDYSVPFRSYLLEDGMMFSHHSKEQVYRELVSTSNLNNVCLKAARRSVFDFEMDYSGMPRICHGEDLLMSAQMLTSAKQIRIVDQNLYFYRQHENSAVHSSQRKRADSVKVVHLYIEKLMEQWNMPKLVPLHHAREVKGWIETFRLASRELSHSEFLTIAEEMADDPYFRCAYVKMDSGLLSGKERLFAALLYRRWFWISSAILYVYNRLNRVQ